MPVLSFDKPKKVRSTEAHNQMHMSDSGVAGTYVPNMSDADQKRWKAKHVRRGDDPRVEIRKTISSERGYAQLLMVVRPGGQVQMSANGKMFFSSATFHELQLAYQEALAALEDA